MEPAVKSYSAQKCSALWLEILEKLYDGKHLAEEYESVKQNLGSWMISESDGSIVRNPNDIFVLTDNGTGSAAESFLTELSSLTRVIRVGGNTAGCSMFGNVIPITLPHSRIPCSFGTKFSLNLSLENTEGTGLLPDLWVAPAEAEALLLALCRKERDA